MRKPVFHLVNAFSFASSPYSHSSPALYIRSPLTRSRCTRITPQN